MPMTLLRSELLAGGMQNETDLILKKLAETKSKTAKAALTRSPGLELHVIANFALDVVHPCVLILFLQCRTSNHWHEAS